MRVLITGAAGFLGRKLSARLVRDGGLRVDNDARPLTRLILADVAAPEVPAASFPVEARAVDMRDTAAMRALIAEGIDLVFHLAAIVSAEAEADFDTGMAVNFDATRHLLDACRAVGGARVVFASSIAVYGPPSSGSSGSGVVRDDTWPRPRNSYGSQKLMAEVLLCDMTRKGFLDGRSVRLPTVVVRPGKPNRAASTFASSIVREPLQGETAVCPVSEEAAMFVASPRTVIENLLRAADLRHDAWGGETSLMLPGLTVTVSEMLKTLETVGGAAARDRVELKRDPQIEAIVAGWPAHFDITRARNLGFAIDHDYRAIVEAFMEDDMVR